MKGVQRNPTKQGQAAWSAHSPPWLFFLNSFFLWATNPFENLIQLTRIHLETILRNTYTGKKKCAFYLIVLEIDLHIVAKTSMTGNYGFLTVVRRLYTFFGINQYIILTLQQCQCFFLMAVRGKILIHEISDSKWNLSSCSSQYLIRSTHQEIPKFILHHCPQVHEIIFINFILSRLSMSAICFNFNFI